MRTSSYVIYVDLPGNCDEMLLVHGYSGAYDKVSKRVATYVRAQELRSAPKPLYGSWVSEPAVDGVVEAPSLETMDILKRRGYLTEMNFEQEEEFFKRMALKLHELHSRTPSYIFMPTYNCNLRCSYCFQDHMRTDPKFHHLLRHMSNEMVDRIFRGVAGIEAAHGADPTAKIHRTIGFFGGEPLLAVNRPVIDYIVRKTLELGTGTFWAVSNATELEAYEDILSADKIASVQVTIDGPPSEHDQRRIYADGSGSFAKIARNISMALDRGISISVRLNIDRRNVSQLPELADVMFENGWDKYPNFSVYTSPIRAANDNVNRADVMSSWELDKSLAAMQKQHPRVALMAQPDDGIKQHARRLFHDPKSVVPSLKQSFCSAHTGMYIFDSFADIYACWEYTGDASIRVGHIREDGTLDMNVPILQTWRSRTVASNPVCAKCRYALHCGGGCAVLAQRSSGEFHMNFCDGYSSRFRSSVAEAYVEHISGVALSERGNRVCDQ